MLIHAYIQTIDALKLGMCGYVSFSLGVFILLFLSDRIIYDYLFLYIYSVFIFYNLHKARLMAHYIEKLY